MRRYRRIRGQSQRKSVSFWMEVAVFFFQAEDGIRDSSVTGVQTCALPISRLIEEAGAGVPPQNGVFVSGRAQRFGLFVPVHGVAKPVVADMPDRKSVV